MQSKQQNINLHGACGHQRYKMIMENENNFFYNTRD